MNVLASHLQIYFTTFARQQRDLSENTIRAYRDTWRILIEFLTTATGKSADRIDLDDITPQNITLFLDHLQYERGNSIATRNSRLTAIRAVLTRTLPGNMEHAGTITQVLAIPPKRHPAPVLEFLNPPECDALINAPDRETWTGRRDHALLVLAIQSGLRVSELTALKLTDIHLGAAASISCTGKGRRARATPLTSTTTKVMREYLSERATRPGDALFSGPGGRALSRDALEHRLRIHCARAAIACPSIGDKHVTMHTLRHTAAMNLLASGVDISVIALWLGHQRTQSTDAYLHADMAIKQAAIDRTRPAHTKPGTYRPEPDILAWLKAL